MVTATAKHMTGYNSSVSFSPKRRITTDVPSSEKLKAIVFVTYMWPMARPEKRKSTERRIQSSMVYMQKQVIGGIG